MRFAQVPVPMPFADVQAWGERVWVRQPQLEDSEKPWQAVYLPKTVNVIVDTATIKTYSDSGGEEDGTVGSGS